MDSSDTEDEGGPKMTQSQTAGHRITCAILMKKGSRSHFRRWAVRSKDPLQMERKYAQQMKAGNTSNQKARKENLLINAAYRIKLAC